ncbi:DUF1800 domain-containing protein [uncultured Gimesia sp.]|uniref:DUF1800 domain-containing protein n=1 Tax=uncultured Gimesia sp. TaxID=1678688 RepID=UPI0030D88C27|tara:strand:+ start:32833 stop:34233 length:1401 start_codon:yes stop_codon:yes gene_type:complete
MESTLQAEKPASSIRWREYRPTKKTPWNLRRVVHLHRRSGFAATWNELQRDLQDGPQASINRVMNGTTCEKTYPEDFERMSASIAEEAVRSNQPDRLKAWWLFQMLFTTDPLTEKLTLLWHNHFATSNHKLEDLSLMRQQNDLFRSLARAPFGTLLTAALHDPALLLWLDAPSNHKGHPNENLARELLELFTLGFGNYTETDVKEAARTLTGWTVIDDQFSFRASQHDAGQKTILNQRRAWKGDELVELLLNQRGTAQHLAERLCQLFLGEEIAQPEDIDTLADGLQTHNLDIDWGTETILQSELFFSDQNIRQRVTSPTEFIIGATRALELVDPPPQTMILADWMRKLGQDLFYPPNVGGWNGGRDWLRTSAIISRANFAAGLSRGQFNANHTHLDWSSFAAKHGRSSIPEDFVAFLADLLFGGEPNPGWIEGIVKTVSSDSHSREAVLKQAVATVLASPEAQLN